MRHLSSSRRATGCLLPFVVVLWFIHAYGQPAYANGGRLTLQITVTVPNPVVGVGQPIRVYAETRAGDELVAPHSAVPVNVVVTTENDLRLALAVFFADKSLAIPLLGGGRKPGIFDRAAARNFPLLASSLVEGFSMPLHGSTFALEANSRTTLSTRVFSGKAEFLVFSNVPETIRIFVSSPDLLTGTAPVAVLPPQRRGDSQTAPRSALWQHNAEAASPPKQKNRGFLLTPTRLERSSQEDWHYQVSINYGLFEGPAFIPDRLLHPCKGSLIIDSYGWFTSASPGIEAGRYSQRRSFSFGQGEGQWWIEFVSRLDRPGRDTRLLRVELLPMECRDLDRSPLDVEVPPVARRIRIEVVNPGGIAFANGKDQRNIQGWILDGTGNPMWAALETSTRRKVLFSGKGAERVSFQPQEVTLPDEEFQTPIVRVTAIGPGVETIQPESGGI